MTKKSLLPSVGSYWAAPAIRRFRDDFDTMFDKFFSDMLGGLPSVSVFNDIQTNSSFPKINVSETDKEYNVEVAVAGFDRDDIKLELKDNILYISADKKEEHEEDGKNYLRKEISSRSFKRAVRFPCQIMSEEAKAKHENGIINVNIKKVVEPEEECGVSIEIN
jgi:HSP20 family protein